jgi:tetratricopeptide (TPR) repeat protein
MIEEKLQWGNTLYQILARHLVNRMAGRYSSDVIMQAVILLHAYTSYEQPVTKKAGVLPAAAEYCTAAFMNGYDVTQAELAELYDVSVTTISKKAQDMIDFAEQHLGKFADAVQSDGPLPTKETDALRTGRMDMEQSMRKLAGSIQDVESGIAGESHPKRQQAIDLLYKAWQETSRRKRIELAHKALALYPDAADGYNILAENEANSLEQVVAYFRKGMLAGERDLGPTFIADNRGYFWGLIETRPYMRAKIGYAEGCLFSGNVMEAIKHCEELLELNPNDNQGVRELLTVAYLRKKRYAEAQQLLERYEEHTAAASYNKMLIEYGLNGVTDKLARLYREARHSNPYIPSYLLGKKRLPQEPPEYIRMGDESEAIDYTLNHYDLWKAEKRLLNWLASAK